MPPLTMETPCLLPLMRRLLGVGVRLLRTRRAVLLVARGGLRRVARPLRRRSAA